MCNARFTPRPNPHADIVAAYVAAALPARQALAPHEAGSTAAMIDPVALGICGMCIVIALRIPLWIDWT